jgi:enoyl-CoA hydratase/carnithine racemase
MPGGEGMPLRLETEGSLGFLEIDCGKANAMGSVELEEFSRLADDLEGGDLRGLVTWSQKRSKRGTALFIAGADVTERSDWSRDEVVSHVRGQRALLARIRRLPLFHVAVVHGVALGWGTEFLLTCDYTIAGPDASFGLPETGLGILPGAGGSSELWSVLGLSQALRLGMTGERIDTAEALRIGLVQEETISLEAGLDRARALVERVARNSPTAVAAFKRACLGAVGLPPEERRELEARAYEHCLDSGEAQIGRENFEAIRKGEEVPWGPRKDFEA